MAPSCKFKSPVWEHFDFLVAILLFFLELKPCKALKKCVEDREAPGSSDHKLISCDKSGYFKLIQKTDTGNICVNFQGIISKTSNVTSFSDCGSFISVRIRVCF